MNAKDLHELGESLFTKRSNLLLLWQELAQNFYPERADFTFQRQIGTEFAADLMSSYPLICRRELGDQLGTMLRPKNKQWAKLTVSDPDRDTTAAKQWMENATTVMHRRMYDRRTLFTKAAKEADNDFATFGQAVEQVRLNRNGDALLFQCHHLRDVAWIENEDGKICAIWRKCKMKARDLKRLFANKVHGQVDQFLTLNKPLEEVECMHMVVEAEMYDQKANGKPYFSLYWDCQHKHLMEEVAVWNQQYNVSRWQTVSGSQYAYSPATVVALPDARLLQAMTYTLLEAGEKATNPPMVATKDVVRSDVAIYAGGVTWVDRDYDERLGDALRPLTQDKSGLPFGVEMMQDSRAILQQAFFLNQLKPFNPATDPQMTAFQAGQIVQDYIRKALPIFEPMEMERNGGICELAFDVLFRLGAFGPTQEIPPELSDADMPWAFESPLHELIEQQKGQKFLEMGEYISHAMSIDPDAIAIPDAKTALRDVLLAVGAPAKWLRDEQTVERIVRQNKAMAAEAQSLAAMQQGADVAKTLSEAQAAKALA